MYNNEFLKINLPLGNQTLTVAGDPVLGVYGRTDINLNLKVGESYYFLTGVRSYNGLAIVLDGVIDQNTSGGPFTIQQVTKNSFIGIDMIENDNRTIISDEKNKVSEIKTLHQLYKDEILTKDEFEKEKKKY